VNNAGIYPATATPDLPDDDLNAMLAVNIRAWAAEFGPRGVRVNSVAPGVTLTPGNESALPVIERMTAGTPTGRPVSPDDIAFAVAFLASGEVRMIHGTTLYVDGGITATRLS
jgi:NAD(P)-dependent dehydrogenase (short-subunit alcohol dehydrogenase family)